MNRRGFLSLLGAATAAAAIPSALAEEQWTPSKSIFLPPAGGWSRGNLLLSVDMIVTEALRVLHQNVQFTAQINRQYDDAFVRPSVLPCGDWPICLPTSNALNVGDVVRIRLPNHMSASA